MQAHNQKIKLGQINFTNCLPINYPLNCMIKGENSLPDFVISEGAPSELNAMFRKGELDLAPISSYEYLCSKELGVLVPGLSISSKKNADSVLLFIDADLEPGALRKIYLTNKSASSVNLLKILLADYWGADVAGVEFIGFDQNHSDMSAKLLIGDEALIEAYKNKNKKVYDLGTAWHELSGGLPMVFGLWTISKKSILVETERFAETTKLFNSLREKGLSDYLPDVIISAFEKTGLPKSILQNYFANLDYNFGEKHQESLDLFERKLHEHKLIQELACR